MALQCNNPSNAKEMACAWSALAKSFVNDGGFICLNNSSYTRGDCLISSVRCNSGDSKTWLALGCLPQESYKQFYWSRIDCLHEALKHGGEDECWQVYYRIAKHMIDHPEDSRTLEHRGETIGIMSCLEKAALHQKCDLPDAHYLYAVNTDRWSSAVHHLIKALKKLRGWEDLTLAGRCWLHLGDLLGMDTHLSEDCHKKLIKELHIVLGMRIRDGFDISSFCTEGVNRIPSRSV